MKRSIYKLFFLFSVIIVTIICWSIWKTKNRTLQPLQNHPGVSELPEASSSNQIDQNQTPSSPFRSPIDRAEERVTKKPFGIYITPATSPVQPERFLGYHTGTDFEVFPEELDVDVPVKTICSGKLLLKEWASGYGGVAVESCKLSGSPITVIYGHLKLASITAREGDALKAGDTLGILGRDKSQETDGERKHLHLGIHKGSDVNIRGYVSYQSELDDWIDACQFICSN